MPTGAGGASGGTGRGVVFGEVAVFTQPKPIAGVPVTNTTDQVRSFTVRATFKAGDKTVATAIGTVYDLLPQSSRVAILSIEGSTEGETSAIASVDAVITVAATTDGSRTALAQKFGSPSVSSDGTPAIKVSITNASGASWSLVIGAAVWRANALVGIASGTVSALGPGQSKTISLPLSGSSSGDRITVWVDRVVK